MIFALSGPHSCGKSTLAKDINNNVVKEIKRTKSTQRPSTNAFERTKTFIDRYYDKFYSINESEGVVQRCSLDQYAYTQAFKNLNWISENEYEELVKRVSSVLEETLDHYQVIVLLPPFETLKSWLEKRMNEEGKNWNEDNFEYLFQVYNEFYKCFENDNRIKSITETGREERIEKFREIYKNVQH